MYVLFIALFQAREAKHKALCPLYAWTDEPRKNTVDRDQQQTPLPYGLRDFPCLFCAKFSIKLAPHFQ